MGGNSLQMIEGRDARRDQNAEPGADLSRNQAEKSKTNRPPRNMPGGARRQTGALTVIRMRMPRANKIPDPRSDRDHEPPSSRVF